MKNYKFVRGLFIALALLASVSFVVVACSHFKLTAEKADVEITRGE